MEVNTENKCSYDEQCQRPTFKNKNNDFYYCHPHNALHLIEELYGNVSTEGKDESKEVIQWYLKEAIESLEAETKVCKNPCKACCPYYKEKK